MITELTQEQLDLLPVYRDKWIKIGMCTDPLDLENAKKAVCKAYRAAGLKEPTQFYTARSPLEAIQVIKKLDPSMSEKTILSDMSYGFHDAYWLSFYEYFREVLNIEECAKLEGLTELAHYSGWLSMYEDVVVFQDRPCAIRMDEQNRTHSEIGPAIEYTDGFGVYMWHGVRIPKEWIEDKANLKAETALTWENVEQRRCACEILGWAKVLKELKSVVIDEDGDPEIGTLVEVEIPEIGKEKFLRVLCGTGREFALPVPPEMKTALEANAWTYDLDPNMLKDLEVRT